MEIEEKAEELLETIWLGVEEGQDESLTTDGLSQEEQEAVTQLLKAGYIAATGGQLPAVPDGQGAAGGPERGAQTPAGGAVAGRCARRRRHHPARESLQI
jgi:hypothetical protein